jgi:CHAT domain-containing protein
LATLWEGWDEAAYHLTLNFYKHLRQSHSKAQALQQAQKTLLKKLPTQTSTLLEPFYFNWELVVIVY